MSIPARPQEYIEEAKAEIIEFASHLNFSGEVLDKFIYPFTRNSLLEYEPFELKELLSAGSDYKVFNSMSALFDFLNSEVQIKGIFAHIDLDYEAENLEDFELWNQHLKKKIVSKHSVPFCFSAAFPDKTVNASSYYVIIF